MSVSAVIKMCVVVAGHSHVELAIGLNEGGEIL